MKITDYIEAKIGRLPKGFVFTYDDFIAEVNKKQGHYPIVLLEKVQL